MIPLFKFGMLAKASTPFTGTISFVGSAISNGTTVGTPSGAAAGDLSLIFDFSINSSGAPTAVVPTNYTQIGSTQTVATVNRAIMSRKDLVGGEGSITGMAGSNVVSKVNLAFRKTAGTWGAAASINQQATTGDPTLQTVTAGAAPCLIIGVYSSNGGAPTRSFSPSQDAEVAEPGGELLFVRYKIYNAAPSNVSVDMNDDGDNILQSFVVPLVP